MSQLNHGKCCSQTFFSVFVNELILLYIACHFMLLLIKSFTFLTEQKHIKPWVYLLTVNQEDLVPLNG